GFISGAAILPRIIDISDGFLFGFGVNGFLGAEYFFAPKMSLSAEYSWGLLYATTGEATATYETWTGGSGGSRTTAESKIAKSSAYAVDVQNAASIILHLYF